MEGRITKGTTYSGKTLNAGDVVDIPEHDYHQFKMTGDIEPVTVIQVAPPEVEPPVEDPKSAKKPKK